MVQAPSSKAQPKRTADPQRAAEQAAHAVAGAAVAAAHAVSAGVNASIPTSSTDASNQQDPPLTTAPPTTDNPTAWPPTASPLGNIWWQARGFPGLPDGIYTYVALRNRGVDGDAPAPKGQLRAAKTTDTVVKHLRETGVPEGVIVFE